MDLNLKQEKERGTPDGPIHILPGRKDDFAIFHRWTNAKCRDERHAQKPHRRIGEVDTYRIEVEYEKIRACIQACELYLGMLWIEVGNGTRQTEVASQRNWIRYVILSNETETYRRPKPNR